LHVNEQLANTDAEDFRRQFAHSREQLVSGDIPVTLGTDDGETRFEKLLFLIKHIERGAEANLELFLRAFIGDFGGLHLSFGRGDGPLRRLQSIPGTRNLRTNEPLIQRYLALRLTALQPGFSKTG
jgi:hypothetical protein